MVIKRCDYGLCKSDSRYSSQEFMKDVFFLQVPNRRCHEVKREIWLRACGRVEMDELVNISDKAKPKRTLAHYVCSKHFVGGKGPTLIYPDPIPSDIQVQTINGRRKIVHSKKPVPISLQMTAAGWTADAENSCESSLSNASASDKGNEILDETDDDDAVEMSDDYQDSSNSPKNTPTLNKKDSLLSINTEEFVLPHNELQEDCVNSTHKPLQIEDIRSFFPCPFNWSLTLYGNEIWFGKLKSESFILKLIIDQNMRTRVEVLQQVLQSHNVLNEIPSKLRTLPELDAALLALDQYKVCQGNADEHLIDVFDPRESKCGYLSWVSEGIHARDCHLLSKGTRCKRCQLYRGYLRCKLARRRKSDAKMSITDGNIRPYLNMNVHFLKLKARTKWHVKEGEDPVSPTGPVFTSPVRLEKYVPRIKATPVLESEDLLTGSDLPVKSELSAPASSESTDVDSPAMDN